MQTYDFHEDECPFYHFDGSYKTLLGSCLIVFGVFGVLLNGWLFVTFIHSHLLTLKSHLLVLNLCTASVGRNLLGFPFAGTSAIAKRWLFGPASCQLFAFLNQFFGVFQIYALLTLVLERYFQAKYYRRKTAPGISLYWVSIGVCWLVSAVFATPPLASYGLYSCDSSGTVCTLQWPSRPSGAKHLGFTVPYVVVCGVLPVFAIFIYMGKAVRLEKIFYKSQLLKEQKRLTRSIHFLVITTLALWIPAGVLAGWQWLPLLIFGYRPHVPPILTLLAATASELATSVPVLSYLAADERLRAALLGRMQRHYALLRPDRADKYKKQNTKNNDPFYKIYEENLV